MLLTPEVVIRAGSGALLAALGLFVLAVARRDAWGARLGATLGSFGLAVVAYNLVPGAPSLRVGLALLGVASACYALAAAAALALLARQWRLGASEDRGWVRASAVVMGAVATLAVADGIVLHRILRLPDVSPAERWLFSVVEPSYILASTALLLSGALAGRAHVREADPRRRRALRLYALAVAAAFGLGVGLYVVPDQLQPNLMPLAGAAALALFVPAWLRATRGPEPARARDVALAPLVAALVGMIALAILENAPASGIVGIGRLASVLALAFAVLRDDLLRVPLPALAERRGLVAAGALATLFMVAEVLQAFFSAAFGLVMGGIAAGALLFAGQPLQRWAESSSRPARAEGAYRRALRLALAHGALTEAQETELAAMADELGLSHQRARALRREVEGSAPAAPR